MASPAEDVLDICSYAVVPKGLKRHKGLQHTAAAGGKGAGGATAVGALGGGDAGCYLNRQQMHPHACVTFLKMAHGA